MRKNSTFFQESLNHLGCSCVYIGGHSEEYRLGKHKVPRAVRLQQVSDFLLCPPAALGLFYGGS